jgi:hypothetical protein
VADAHTNGSKKKHLLAGELLVDNKEFQVHIMIVIKRFLSVHTAEK